MYRSRDELLPRPVLAADQHACRGLRNLVDLVDYGANRVRPPDDLVARFDRLLESCVLFVQLEMLERVTQRDQNAVGIERLFEDVVGAELGGLDRRLDRRVPADHDDRRARVGGFHALERLDPVDAAHFHVEEDELWMPALELGDTVDGVRRRAYVVALELEQLAECRANSLLVVDEDRKAHV